MAHVQTDAPVKTLADNCRSEGRDCWCDIKEVKAKAFARGRLKRFDNLRPTNLAAHCSIRRLRD